MAGDSEVGGNGSVHWHVKHANDGVIGTDTKRKADGEDAMGGGTITVEVMFEGTTPPITVKSDRVVIEIPAHEGTTYKRQVNVNWKNK